MKNSTRVPYTMSRHSIRMLVKGIEDYILTTDRARELDGDEYAKLLLSTAQGEIDYLAYYKHVNPAYTECDYQEDKNFLEGLIDKLINQQ